jgi:phospholipid/cholesterol/gamma-HCH transport system permease protein
MATVPAPAEGALRGWAKRASDVLDDAGAVTEFALEMLRGVFRGAGRNTLLPICYNVGVTSVPVVAITGLFIGMVLAVQAYAQFAAIGMATRLGPIINTSVIRELGPVLAATMLAGRVGSAMAAELATMKITEQVDALAVLGVNPVQHLGAPRLLACTLLIPLLTILANFVGILGGALVCTQIYHVEPYHYWYNSRGYIDMYDLVTGLIKPTIFGATIAIVSCHRGLHSEPGAEGVGRAATRAFVAAFIAILVLDFFLAMLLNQLHSFLWPSARGAL